MKARAKWGLGMAVFFVAAGCSTNGSGLSPHDGQAVDSGDAGAGRAGTGSGGGAATGGVTGSGGATSTGGTTASGGASGGTGTGGRASGSGGTPNGTGGTPNGTGGGIGGRSATGGAGGTMGTGGAGGGLATGGAGGRLGTGGVGGRAGTGGAGSGAVFCGGSARVPCPNPDRQFCEFLPGTCPVAGADMTGMCMVKPEVCTLEYAPVCGCDGKTYSNDCMRRGGGVSRALTGPCPAVASP